MTLSKGHSSGTLTCEECRVTLGNCVTGLKVYYFNTDGENDSWFIFIHCNLAKKKRSFKVVSHQALVGDRLEYWMLFNYRRFRFCTAVFFYFRKDPGSLFEYKWLFFLTHGSTWNNKRFSIKITWKHFSTGARGPTAPIHFIYAAPEKNKQTVSNVFASFIISKCVYKWVLLFNYIN